MYAIHCEKLTKRYGDVVALKELDLSVPQGAVFGFLGRNGAGKTTTIRLLAGLAHPSGGRAWIQGEEVTGEAGAARRSFGYLPQSPAFYSWMTAREYLDYAAALYEMAADRRRRRVAEVLQLVALEDAANRRIGGFSGGMHQRLGIAQALLHEPPVLLLDEPTAALDPAGRYEVLSLLEGMRGRVTVFLSSHILGDVERVCDTIAIIHRGQLLLVSSPSELLAQHATNTILLSLDSVSLAHSESFAAALAAQLWVAGVEAEGGELRVLVADISKAQEEILPLVVAHDIHLRRFEWVRPTLEEVFLSLSS